MKLTSIFLALITTSSIAFAQQENKVEKLSNGVEINHLLFGEGKFPNSTSKVTVNYEGTLENGKVFDSSYSRGKPINFRLDQVIECWKDGVQKMKVGGKAVLTCPSETAYGQRGVGGVIPPNAKLTFKVELIDISN